MATIVWVDLKGRYDVREVRDVSHALARRSAVTVVVDAAMDRDDARIVVRRVVRRQRWRWPRAHIVFVWLYRCHPWESPEHAVLDTSRGAWVCRAQYIDAKLDPSIHPSPLRVDEQLGEIVLEWARGE